MPDWYGLAMRSAGLGSRPGAEVRISRERDAMLTKETAA
jgi:hypothetical protein